jgi:TIGR00159 family protein
VITIIRQCLNYISNMAIGDVVEILLISACLYQLMRWIQRTRAWALVKGLVVIFAFYAVAILLEFNVILWILNRTLGVGVTAFIILFQPELRKALEQIGKKNLFVGIFTSEDIRARGDNFNEVLVNELVKASIELGKTKTGALIVLERTVSLKEFERTGIMLDSIVSSQLLINIFEHNTPLHDGAIIISDNRIAAATCYLPLSENMSISKDLGTRHRAALGVSEVSDSITITVSEETGSISVAEEGALYRNVSNEFLKEALMKNGAVGKEVKKTRIFGQVRGGKQKNEKNINK